MITLDQIERAVDTLRPYLPATPLRPSHAASMADVFLKLECWQPTGSFKVRGALNAIRSDSARPVVAASAGNHALGIAWAAWVTAHVAPVTLFIPRTAPRSKREKLSSAAVHLVVGGETYDEAQASALRHAEATGARLIHAFDDPLVAAGQGTVGLEIIEQLPEVGTVVVPVGGGGLISGLAVAMKARRPATRIMAVQPEASPALRRSLETGRALLEYPAGHTLADGLAGGIGEILWEHRHLVDDVVDVPERAIQEAIVSLLSHDQVLAEASGAIGVAALRAGLLSHTAKPVVAVITGSNLDVSVLARLLDAYPEEQE